MFFILSTLKLLSCSLSTGLIILKYLGLGLAAGSSVWGTINELTVKTTAGLKKLTSAGRISIILTLLGLVISVISEDLQRRQAVTSQAAQVAAEAKRTNDIIIAGQPLTSLAVTWTFRGMDAGLLAKLQTGEHDAQAFIDDQQGERDGEQNSAVNREHVLYPFLAELSRRFTNDTAPSKSPEVAVLLALDDDQNSVLPFGFLDAEKQWYDGIHAGPPSLEIGSHGDAGNPDLLNWPRLERTDANVMIAWRLDPSTFIKSLNRQNGFIVPTAKAPRVLRIAILFDIEKLPFKAGNFAQAEDQNFWTFRDYRNLQNDNFQGKVAPITKGFASSVQLVPNNSSLVLYNYRLNQVYETLFLDTYDEAIPGLRCVMFEYDLVN